LGLLWLTVKVIHRRNMRYSAILQALALRMKDLEQQGDPVEIDRDTRVVVAAARGIVNAIAKEISAPVFDFDHEIQKAILLKAVASINPELELTDEEKEVIAEVDKLSKD
jgi:hypothetical protein